MTHYLAIDIGTESARAAVFTSDGTRIGEGHGTYATTYPRPGWAEQNPADWWIGAVSASRAALAEAGTDRVTGVSVATTSSSVVFLDVDGRPLRPALLWMDSRSSVEAERTAQSTHPALAFSGGSDSSEWLVPKAMWVARNEPQVYADSRFIGESVDYLTWKLTGQWVGSRLNATCKWNYDSRTGDVPHELYAELGIADLGHKLPSDILAVGSLVAPLSARAASELGLSGTAVVGVGGIDAHLSLIPLKGATHNPVSIVAGTSNAFIAELEEPLFSPTIWGPYPRALSDLWLVEGGQVSAGSALTWLAERVFGCARDQLPSLTADAALVAPAGHGLLVLDNFMGNRTPLRDSKLRGAILGLQLGTTRAELYRAAVESVAYGTRQVLESFQAVGVDTSTVVLSGGIRHNPLWLQVTADVLGRPLSIVEGENLTLLACAAIAAAAAKGTDVTTEAAAFAPTMRMIEPSENSAAAYNDAFALYIHTVTATTDASHRLVAMTAPRVTDRVS